MTRKDFELIARAIREEREAWVVEGDSGTAGVTAIDGVANLMADFLVEENPRFDRERFLKAALGEDQ